MAQRKAVNVKRRVRDKETGYVFTTAMVGDHLEEVEGPAVDSTGRALPPDYSKALKAAGKAPEEAK